MSEKANHPNLFATVLSYPAPSANYRGETELSRSIIQKVTDGRWEYPIISPEAMRNALREMLIAYGLPSNRERLEPVAGVGKIAESDVEDKQQLAVKFRSYPDPVKFIDDFFFGYLLAIKGAEMKKLRDTKKDPAFPLKRDSVLRMNLAKALASYRHSTVFTQSPQIKDSPWTPGGGDAKSNCGLLHRETAVTAFQYPFALAWNDCKPKPEWTRALLKAIGELNGVAGNHARSYFEMAPASIIVRLTPQLVAGYDTYGFRIQRDKLDDQAHTHTYAEVVDGLLHEPPDYTPGEFYIGGKIVKDMDAAGISKLTALGVKLDRDPRRLLETVARDFTGGMA